MPTIRRGPPRTSASAKVEIVLVADDLDAVHGEVVASGWPLSTPMTDQPWGMTDFRLVDPDGIYIRVTAPPGEGSH